MQVVFWLGSKNENGFFENSHLGVRKTENEKGRKNEKCIKNEKAPKT